MGRRLRSPGTLASIVKDSNAATRAKGLMPRAQMKDLKPGSVWWAVDRALSLPDSRIEGKNERKDKGKRPVVVVQQMPLLASKDPETVLVVPCSSSRGTNDLRKGDFIPPPRCEPFRDAEVTIHARLVQPLLKADLAECVGRLPEEVYRGLQRELAKVLDLPRPLPSIAPRSSEVAGDHQGER